MYEAKTTYWPQLDGLRTIAFALVFFHHHGPVVLTNNELIQNAINKISEWGWLGVDLFFILSAFLVTHLLCAEQRFYEKISLSKFYARRALRIWPLFFLVLTVTCFVYPLFAPHKASHLYAIFLRDIVLPLYTFTGNFALPIYFNAIGAYCKESGLEFMVFVSILTPFWSLCIEEQFYLLWGLSARIANSLHKLIIFASFLLGIGFVARLALLSWNREVVASTAYYMNSFWHLETIMMGALTAMILLAKPEIVKPLRSGWLPTVCFIGCLVTYFGVVICGPSIHSWSYLLAPMMTLASAAGTLLLLLALSWEPLKRAFSIRWIMQIGKLTFGMYVFHFFVTWFGKTQFKLGVEGLPGLFSLILCFGLTWLAAVVSWKVLEKPMNDMRKKLSRVHAEPQPVSPKSAEPVIAVSREADLVLK